MAGARGTAKKARRHRALSKKGRLVQRDLGSRTLGEELWVRRRLAGFTGPEAAAFLGVGRTALWEAEARGKGAKKLLAAAKAIWTGPPGLPELLALARRRQGWGLPGTARRCGISHTTLLAAERRGDAWLVHYWEGRGFTFVRTRGRVPDPS